MSTAVRTLAAKKLAVSSSANVPNTRTIAGWSSGGLTHTTHRLTAVVAAARAAASSVPASRSAGAAAPRRVRTRSSSSPPSVVGGRVRRGAVGELAPEQGRGQHLAVAVARGDVCHHLDHRLVGQLVELLD